MNALKTVTAKYRMSGTVILNIFDCDIMIGGYVGGYIKSYMAQLSQKTARYNKFEKDTMYIKNCTYEKEASAVGAAMYFVDKYFNEL